MKNDSWTFFQAFLKSPLVVASIVPSSSFLTRRLIKVADATNGDVVVELGAGTGGVTRALLDAMPPDGRLLAIERTARFVHSLSRIEDGRLEVVHGCASAIGAELDCRGLPAADVVVSGIPFSTLPEALAAEIITSVYEALGPGGRFVAYQFTDRVADYARETMGPPEVQHELLNVPPMRIFSWQKGAWPRADGHDYEVRPRGTA